MSQHEPRSDSPTGRERGRGDPDRATKPLAPRIILLLVAGAILLAIGLWTGGNGGSQAPTFAPAPLAILEPADSGSVDAPLDVTFSTEAPLHLTPAGWQADGYHLHALLDGAQIMPGALDIRALGEGRYRWRLKDVGPGGHDIRLVWARADHHAIPEGASADVPFTVK